MKSTIQTFTIITLLTILSMFSATSNAQMNPPDNSRMVMSNYSFNDTVTLLKRAIEQQNLMVINELDGQRMLRMVGVNIGGMKQIFFFHPQYMAKVLEANQMAGIQIPLKFIVMERNGNAAIRYFEPSVLLESYEGVEEVAEELDELVNNIISEVTE